MNPLGYPVGNRLILLMRQLSKQTSVQPGHIRTPRRHILTERQRRTLLALPTEEPSPLKHYTLAEDDLEHIRHRRRPHNRLGFALQLCALRYPGRLLSPGEVIPPEVLRFLAAQTRTQGR